MNLALITQDFPPEIGGIETYAAEVARRFARECDFFLVIAPVKPEAVRIDEALPYPVKRVATPNSFLGMKAMLEAPVIFKKHNIRNIFHTQWQTLPASVFAQQQRIVDHIFVAVHARELLFNPFNEFPVAGQLFERYKRWLLSKVDLFFPVSNYTAHLLRNHGIEKNRIEVVINGTDPTKFYPVDQQIARRSIGVEASKMLLTITRLVSRKGVDIALKAFKKVLKNHPDSYYVVVGEGPQKEELQQLARELQIEDAVRFVGRVAYHKLVTYYNACDIFVMPSKTELPNVEGFGIVFLEANACGKPVIGTFSGGIPSAVLNGETGILVKENDPLALVQAINKLFGDEQCALMMGEEGRKRVEKEANWDMAAQKLMRLMKGKI